MMPGLRMPKMRCHLSPRRFRVARWRFVPAHLGGQCSAASRAARERFASRTAPRRQVACRLFAASRPARRRNILQSAAKVFSLVDSPSRVSAARRIYSCPSLAFSGAQALEEGATDRCAHPRQAIGKPWVNVNLPSPPPEELLTLIFVLHKMRKMLYEPPSCGI